ncbi:ankyrin repeat-containing domain protein [Bombardia bombarda]|uniref:Ankyrin repeat-containing domain protein n=1 Tax=Bombardia bombarda TaxID=252184 RepID=A0AA40CFI8_9PEZI|nr:ankyrin repeat-containing domain protein [Bombardia bombarda]
MELNIELTTDRNNRRRLQNRIAQRKFRQSRAEKSNQERAIEAARDDSNNSNNSNNDAPSAPPATATHHHQDAEARSSQPSPPFQDISTGGAFSSDLFANSIHALGTPNIPQGIASYNSSPGLDDANFLESLVSSTHSSLSQNSYQTRFDQALDFHTAPNGSSRTICDGAGPGTRHDPLQHHASVTAPHVHHTPVTAITPHRLNNHSQDSSVTALQATHTEDGHSKGWLSALHIAARRGHERIVSTLIKHNIDCNEKDSDGRTALMHAAIDGHDSVASALLAHGARISDADRRSRTALHWAVLGQHEGVLRLLLTFYADRGWEHGLDIMDDLGWTALHIAVEKGFEAGVEMLLQSGANLHAKARKTCNGDDDKDDSRLTANTTT